MTLIVQIVLGLSILVGLVTIFISSKNWHWTQLVLVLSIFFTAIGFLVLGAETVRIHRNLRKGIPGLEKKIANLERQNDELLHGAGEKPGILKLDHQLKIVTRERGRAWCKRGRTGFEVMPTGQVDQQGRVSVEITKLAPHGLEKPVPHGLEKDAIVYAFESGEPNAADPADGMQYLGEFRVTEVQEGGASLEPILLIDNRSGKRLADSEGPWSLYETMPIDRHRLYANFSEEQLREMLPEESVEEYLRHGTEATPDDDEWHVTGLDENGERVGPENIDQAVKRLYDRSLRDYAFIFSQLAGEKVTALSSQRAVIEDNGLLVKSLAGAEETGKFRQQQIDALNLDLTDMKQDRAAAESHRNAVQNLLTNRQELIQAYRQANTALAKRFTASQLGMVQYINSVAPAPGRSTFLSK